MYALSKDWSPMYLSLNQLKGMPHEKGNETKKIKYCYIGRARTGKYAKGT